VTNVKWADVCGRSHQNRFDSSEYADALARFEADRGGKSVMPPADHYGRRNERLQITADTFAANISDQNDVFARWPLIPKELR